MKLTKKLLNKLIKEEFEKTILKEQLAVDQKMVAAAGRMSGGLQGMTEGDFEAVSQLIRVLQELLEARVEEFNQAIAKGGATLGEPIDVGRLE